MANENDLDTKALEAVTAALEPTLPQPDSPADDAGADADDANDVDAGTPEGEGGDEKPEGEQTPEEKAATAEAAAKKGEKPEGEQTPEEKAAAAEAAAKKVEKPESEQTPEEKAAAAEAAAKKKPDPKPLDAINDPIPAGVSERTRERITSLVGMVKERDTAVEKAVQERNDLVEMVTSTGVTPDNFTQTLEFLRLFNSGSAEDNRKAFNFLLGQAKALADKIGEVLPGQDPLEGHADLLADVQANKLPRERAAEIAKARNRDKATTTNNERSAAEQQRWVQDKEAAMDQLNELGQTLSKTDPLFAKKAPLVTEKLKPLFAQLHPSQWYKRYVKEYREFQVPALSAPQPGAGAKKPDTQPLRGNKQPSGQGAKQPTSAQEAMDAALANMGR